MNDRTRHRFAIALATAGLVCLMPGAISMALEWQAGRWAGLQFSASAQWVEPAQELVSLRHSGASTATVRGASAGTRVAQLDLPSTAPRSVSALDDWRRVDQSQWSIARRQLFDLWIDQSPDPVAALRFPGNLNAVAVFPDESERAMTLGAAYLKPWLQIAEDGGNIALASHRDGPFRMLAELEPGDSIELLDTSGRSRMFIVRWHRIVEPDDVSVLDPTQRPSLTLVTCYPFYFIGSAPQRYIVRAEESGWPASRSVARR